MSIQDIDPQFRLDADVAPTFIVKNYNVETGEFSVFYNDGTLNDDEWYGPGGECNGTALIEPSLPYHPIKKRTKRGKRINK